MQMPYKLSRLTAALLIATGSTMLTAIAQEQPYPQGQPPSQQLSPEQQTTMVLLRVVREANGQQYVVTPRGFEIPVPAPGVPPQDQQLAVYRDYLGNYWYNDAYNQPVKVTAAQLQWKVGQLYGAQAAAVVGTPVNTQPPPQQPYPQQQAPVQQTTINEQPAQPSNSSSALGTGLAAAAGGTLGGMMGGMIGGAMYDGINNGGGYYGMPYGTPMYRGADGHAYYYNKSGNTVNVNPNNNNQHQFDNWNKQGTWKDNPNNPYNQNHPNYPNNPNNQNHPYDQNRPNNPNQANNLKNDQGKFNQNQNGNKSGRQGRREQKERTMDGSGAKPFKGRLDGGGERRFGGGGRRR
jgi:hypothetical protein